MDSAMDVSEILEDELPLPHSQGSATSKNSQSSATTENSIKNGNVRPQLKQPQPDDKVKTLVAQLMSQESSRLGFIDKQTPKDGKRAGSTVWNNFKEATVDGDRVGIFKCNNCTALFMYKPATGTTSMNRHNCNKNSSKTDTKSNNKIMENFLVKTVPQESIRNLNRDVTVGLCIDLQPLSRVETRGFLHMAQAFINFEAKFGRVKVADVVQHRTTLQRNRLPEIYSELHANVKTTINNIPAFPNFAFTSDMWTEKHHSQGFLGLSAHFIDSNWVLQKRLLGMEAHDESKTTTSIRASCKKILTQYFDATTVDYVFEKSTAVTDGEPAMKAVFPNREPCHCHNINLLCEWTFSEKKPIDPEKIKKREEKGNPYHPKRLFNLSRDCPSIAATIKGIKDLVTHFKQTHLNSKLTRTLKQEVPTRFISLLFLLESYKTSSEEVKSILIETGKVEMLLQVSDNLVKRLVEFLEPMNESCKVLSGDKYPTINLVALQYYNLRKHIEIKAEDCEEMKILKGQAAHCFQEYCKTTTFHYMACLLDPRYRSLKFIDRRTKNVAVRLLQDMLKDEEENSSEETANLPVTRKGRFAELEDDVVTSSELDRYLNFLLPERKQSEPFEVLKFWRDSREFPMIKKIAMSVLAIPASESTAERTFASSGYTMSPRRTLLDSDTLSQTVYVQQNSEIRN